LSLSFHARNRAEGEAARPIGIIAAKLIYVDLDLRPDCSGEHIGLNLAQDAGLERL
jgi:hypothetical protein